MAEKFLARENTPEGIAAWPDVFEGTEKTYDNGEKVREYSLDIILEANTDVSKLQELGYACAAHFLGSDDTKWPHFKNKLIRETGEKNLNRATGKPWEGYEPGRLYISCSSIYRPPIIDVTGRTIIDPTEFYGGCKVIAAVGARLYDYLGNVGVKFQLIALIKMADGKPFGADRPDPTQIFKPLIKTTQVAAPQGAQPTAAAGARRRVL